MPRSALHSRPVSAVGPASSHAPARLARAWQVFKRWGWVLIVLLATGVALMPTDQMPQAIQFWDKAQHTLAYAGLALTGLWAIPRRPRLVLGGLALHGALVEVLQATLTTTRQGEWSDWLADVLGLLLAWALAAVVSRWVR
jgi:VanZ family protein